MTLHERWIGDVTILDIDGRMTVEDGADVFRDAVRRLVRQDRVKLVLGFQAAPYIDSTALGEVVRAYTSATRKGGTLKLLKRDAARPRSADDHKVAVGVRSI